MVGAVDIGGTNIAVGIIDAGGRILASRETPTAARDGFDAAMSRVWSLLQALRHEADATLGGIGIGCTGPVDPFSGQIGEVDFLPGWQGFNPVTLFAGLSGLRVALENDADAAALGEYQWGAGRGRRHLISVTVGTGIGGGIVLNGSLYRGVGGAHPEIGHHVIDSAGPVCFCGSHGCWERLVSGPAIVERMRQQLPATHAHRNSLTAALVFQMARDGDALAAREVARVARYLGIGVANLVTLFAPEIIVLTGSIMKSADLLLPGIRQVVDRHCGLVPAADVQIQVSELGAAAPLIGAGAVWRHRFENSGVPC